MGSDEGLDLGWFRAVAALLLVGHYRFGLKVSRSPVGR